MNHTTILRILVASSLLAVATHASYCGESMVPYSFEVLPGGQPVLGCARPTCFGWAPSGQPHSYQASFYRVRGSADGFSRQQDPQSIPPFSQGDVRYRIPQTARCESGFGSVACASPNSWVGGIAPLLNITSYPTTLRCCVYEPLRQSEDRGVATVGGGQIVVGGEVLSEGVQYAFDYISDITKNVNYDQSVQYDVSIRRFACAPLPGPTHYTEKYVKNQHGDVRFAPRAFQDPIQGVNEPLVPPRGHGSHGHSHGSRQSHGSHGSREHQHHNSFEENGVIEEIVREEGIQLPPGTQFQQQPIVEAPPPPVQQPVPPPPQFVAAPPQTGFVAAPPVAAQGYYFPVSYQQGGFLCFSGDMTVTMGDGTEKRMDELEKNDFVMAVTTGGVQPVPVHFWLHRNPNTVAEFHRLETENGRVIKLTAQHYIYKGDCANVGKGLLDARELVRTAVYAEEVAEGDCLYTLEEENKMREVRVVKADKVVDTGIYAPMTSNGKIIVNGVHVSCHTSINSHGLQKTYFSAIDAVRSVWTTIFGESETSFVDTPMGMELFKSIFDLVAPKDLSTF